MTILEDITYTICETAQSVSGASRQDEEKVSQTASVGYQVIVDSLGADEVTEILPENISTELIRTIPELPLVNGSTYNYGGTSNPYLICSGKTITRDEDHRLKFDIQVDFTTTAESDQEQESGSDPEDLDDITPTVSGVIGYIERPIYVDKDGIQCFRLPSETPYPSPVMEKVPTLTLTITQYEASITFAQMIARSYKLNDATYRAAGPHSWMTGPVKASTVKVKLASGEVTAAKVTYTLTLSEASFIAVVTGEPATATAGGEFFYGHSTTKALVDAWATKPSSGGGGGTPESSGGRQPITDEDSDEQTTGYIYKDGFQRIPGAEGDGSEDRPSYNVHRTQKAISFSFLQA